MNIAIKNYIINTDEIESVNFFEYSWLAGIEFRLKSKRYISLNSSDECDNITKEEVILIINKIKKFLNPTIIV